MPKNFCNFERVYIINLDKYPEKFVQSINELEKTNYFNKKSIIRFPGVIINGGETQLDREAGCRESHFNIIENALKNDYDNVVIFEDDILMDMRYIHLIKSDVDPFIKRNEKDIDIFYFGGNHNVHVSKESERPIKIDEHVDRVFNTFATHAYIVFKQAYEKILSYRNIVEPIDILLTKVQKEGKSYCINPRVITQRQGFSFIMNRDVNYDQVLKEN